MPTDLDASQRKQMRKIERIAPALVSLARGFQAAEVARELGVSTVTILNWMDWSWKHRVETEAFLTQQYPTLGRDALVALWARVERRRAKRQRRLDLTSVLSGTEATGGLEDLNSR